MAAHPFKYLTAKQLRAMKRAMKRAGEGPIKKGTCRKVSKREVLICRDSRGHYVGTSPHRVARARGITRSQRLYQGY